MKSLGIAPSCESSFAEWMMKPRCMGGLSACWKFLQQEFFPWIYKTQVDPIIPLLGAYNRELKMDVPTETCTQIFIAALFIIAVTWKQLKCPSTDKWINKM